VNNLGNKGIAMTSQTTRTPGPDHPVTITPNPGRVVVTVGGERGVNAVWTDEQPDDAVAAIREHVAFYLDRVDSIALLD
jgi:uncharacterized protein (DUF427 family)